MADLMHPLIIACHHAGFEQFMLNFGLDLGWLLPPSSCDVVDRIQTRFVSQHFVTHVYVEQQAPTQFFGDINIISIELSNGSIQ
jgi:hypothetical protein